MHRLTLAIFSLLSACAALPQDDTAAIMDVELLRPVEDWDPGVPVAVDDMDELRLSLGHLGPSLDRGLNHLVQSHNLSGQGDLRVHQAIVDDLGMTHLRIQQVWDGVPVWGGEAIVHIGVDGALGGPTDKLAQDIQVDTTPSISLDAAVDVAESAYGGAFLEGDGALYIWRGEEGDHLVYLLPLAEEDENGALVSRPQVMVDAHTGEEVYSWESLESGTGTSLYNGSVSFTTKYNGGSWGYYYYTLEQPQVTGGSEDYGTPLYNLFSDTWTTSSMAPAVSSYWAAQRTVEFLYRTFGYSGYNGAGGKVSILADYGVNEANAFYTGGGAIAVGNGDGVSFSDFSAVDIVAHEVGHGVTASNAGLVYSGESGGLNESFSDVMGALVDRYVDGTTNTNTWLIGEDCYTPGVAGDALRYMGNPTADGGSFDYYDTSIGAWDPHQSSGVGNLAFKLLSTGGSHPRLGGASVPGLGPDVAAKIWMRAYRYYLTSTSTYADARNATLFAAADYNGVTSSTVSAVDQAWDAVGVTGDTLTWSYLSGTGASIWAPSGTYFYAPASGNFTATLRPQSSTVNFGLALYKWSGSAWTLVGWSQSGSGNQRVNYVGTPGYYIWEAYSVSGAGYLTVASAHP